MVANQDHYLLITASLLFKFKTEDVYEDFN